MKVVYNIWVIIFSCGGEISLPQLSIAIFEFVADQLNTISGIQFTIYIIDDKCCYHSRAVSFGDGFTWARCDVIGLRHRY
jgi:hypothetical protein